MKKKILKQELENLIAAYTACITERDGLAQSCADFRRLCDEARGIMEAQDKELGLCRNAIRERDHLLMVSRANANGAGAAVEALRGRNQNLHRANKDLLAANEELKNRLKADTKVPERGSGAHVLVPVARLRELEKIETWALANEGWAKDKATDGHCSRMAKN